MVDGEPGPAVIDLNATNDVGKTVLYVAAERGNLGVVRTLLAAGGRRSLLPTRPSREGQTEAEAEAEAKAEREIPVVGNIDLEIATPSGTPLGIACQRGNLKTVHLLLNCGADVNGCGRLPFE